MAYDLPPYAKVGHPSYDPAMGPSGGAVGPTAGCMWFSLYLDAGMELAETKHQLFTVARGERGPCGRRLSLTDTNMRAGSGVGARGDYQVQEVSWIVREAAAQTDVDRLSQAHGRSMADLILEHGVLFWDFGQVEFVVGPLWAGGLPSHITIPASSQWRMVLSFGPDAPKLDMDHVVRVLLRGSFKPQLSLRR